MTSVITGTLQQRGTRYGKFETHANITQDLKMTLQAHPGWEKLTRTHREALDMIMHKVGRILNGDPNYIDSWHDIQGYAKLVEDHLVENGIED